jgi:oligopeptidase B
MRSLLPLLSTVALLTTFASSSSAKERREPPVAPKHPHETTLHGDRRVDDYYWLREKGSPEVRTYLQEENAYTDAMTANTKALQEKLYQEMLGRIQQTDLSVPYRYGDWFYYSRTEEGKQYSIHCRKKGSLDAPEEVVLDLNRLAEGHSFLGLGAYSVSDDGSMLAYSTDTTGFRVYDLHVRDLKEGVDLPDQAGDVETVAWDADGRTLFYTVKDAAKRPHRVMKHRLGQSQDELVYEEKDERFTVEVGRTRSRGYLLLSAASHTQTEVRFRKAGSDDPWTLVAARETEHEYHLDHHGERFYILTNQGGRNFRLVSAPVASPGKEHWKEEIPHRPDVMLEDLDCFARHMVVQEREDGLVRFRVIDLADGSWHRIEFPEPVYTASPSSNRQFDTAEFRYSYQSFLTPQSVFDYDMKGRTSTLKKRTEVLGDFDPTRYESARLHATASDGTKIPISIVSRKGTRRDGSAPMLLYGYGSYGLPLSAGFNSNRLSLLDRGVVYAVAHVRGGGEMGKAWHDQGRMMNKRNTFTDFIACARHLVKEKWTSEDRLAISGGSAGGLLMGAVANMEPGLFKLVLSQVPFVDVINSMSDSSLPLTVGEFEEWGNPAEKKAEYEYMKTYCPYTNVGEHAYPTMLVRTSLHDSQVMYWEPAKYVAKLRTHKTDKNPLLFKVNMKSGHGGASGRYDFLRDVAFDYAFLLTRLGIEKPATAVAP